MDTRLNGDKRYDVCDRAETFMRILAEERLTSRVVKSDHALTREDFDKTRADLNEDAARTANGSNFTSKKVGTRDRKYLLPLTVPPFLLPMTSTEDVWKTGPNKDIPLPRSPVVPLVLMTDRILSRVAEQDAAIARSYGEAIRLQTYRGWAFTIGGLSSKDKDDGEIDMKRPSLLTGSDLHLLRVGEGRVQGT